MAVPSFEPLGDHDGKKEKITENHVEGVSENFQEFLDNLTEVGKQRVDLELCNNNNVQLEWLDDPELIEPEKVDGIKEKIIHFANTEDHELRKKEAEVIADEMSS